MEQVIILDGMKFDWFTDEIERFKQLWSVYSEHSNNTVEIIKQIASDMKQSADELFLLALDLKIKEEI